MHPSKPIRPPDLAEGGAVGHVYNRKARRARASQEKAAARRASREQARADLVMRKVSDLTCAAVARDWENLLIEQGITILGEDAEPGERRPADDTTLGYRMTPDGQIGDPVCRFGVAGRVVDGKVQIDSVGLFPLGPGDTREPDPS